MSKLKINGIDDDTSSRLTSAYQESDKVSQEGLDAQNAYNAVAQWQSNGKARAALDNWKNTGAFSYDPDSDSLYQTAKANAIANGKIAMQDTVGQASALTGGYGNSYAATAGSQAYQNYLRGLDDDLATYYQLALEQYQQNKDDLLTEYSLENELEQQDYSRLYNQFNLAETRYNNDRAFDYGIYSDDVSKAATLAGMENSDYWAQQNLAEEQRQFDANLAESQRQYNTSRADSIVAAANETEADRRLSSSNYYNSVVSSFANKKREADEEDDKARSDALNNEIFDEADILLQDGAISEAEYVILLDKYVDKDWLEEHYKELFDELTD